MTLLTEITDEIIGDCTRSDDIYGLGSSSAVAKRPMALSREFMAAACSLLATMSIVKLEVQIKGQGQLADDIHMLITSPKHHVCVDDLDLKGVRLNLDASDFVASVLVTALAIASFEMKSPQRVFAFLPYLGIVLKSVLSRQTPAALALLYVLHTAEDEPRVGLTLLLVLLFCVELLLWLEVAMTVLLEWKRFRHNQAVSSCTADRADVQTCSDANKTI